MDRNTERGQMIIEMLVLVLMFAGLFLIAVGISERSDEQQAQFRFQNSNYRKPH